MLAVINGRNVYSYDVFVGQPEVTTSLGIGDVDTIECSVVVQTRTAERCPTLNGQQNDSVSLKRMPPLNFATGHAIVVGDGGQGARAPKIRGK